LTSPPNLVNAILVKAVDVDKEHEAHGAGTEPASNDDRGSNMWRRVRDIEWTFSNTAEGVTAVLLALAIAAVLV
jgi:hypothetical protein